MIIIAYLPFAILLIYLNGVTPYHRVSNYQQFI